MEIFKKSVAALFTLGIIVFLAWRILREATMERAVVVLITFVVLIGIGVLRVRSRKFDEALMTAFVNYMVFSFVVMLIAGVLLLFRWLSEWIMQSLSGTPQIIALVAFGMVLAVPLVGLSTQSWRKKFFKAVHPLGWVAPLAGSLLIVMVSVLFFADMTFLSVDPQELKTTSGKDLTYAALQDFYLWYFLDAVPSLKVNETLKWDRPPVSYEGGGVGALLLLFKITVILPIIGTFSGYWKFRQEEREERDKAGSSATGSAASSGG